MRNENYLFHALGIAPQSREKVCVQWRILKPLVARATENYLFHALGIAPQSREKVCVQWRILKPLVARATDHSKAMILV